MSRKRRVYGARTRAAKHPAASTPADHQETLQEFASLVRSDEELTADRWFRYAESVSMEVANDSIDGQLAQMALEPRMLFAVSVVEMVAQMIDADWTITDRVTGDTRTAQVADWFEPSWIEPLVRGVLNDAAAKLAAGVDSPVVYILGNMVVSDWVITTMDVLLRTVFRGMFRGDLFKWFGLNEDEIEIAKGLAAGWHGGLADLLRTAIGLDAELVAVGGGQ